eukprot:6757627-Alexandrium_andersonii.AAC.1
MHPSRASGTNFEVVPGPAQFTLRAPHDFARSWIPGDQSTIPVGLTARTPIGKPSRRTKYAESV